MIDMKNSTTNNSFKLIILILTLLVNTNHLCSQIDKIKLNCKELCFDIPIKAKKYDVRTKFNSDNNFFKITDKARYDNIYIIGARFYENYKLSYVQYSKNNYIFYYFKPNTEICYMTKIVFDFNNDGLKFCLQQLDELNEIFNKISFYTSISTIKIDNEKVGEGKVHYASKTSLNTPKSTENEFRTAFLDYSYTPRSYGYELSVYIYHNNIY